MTYENSPDRVIGSMFEMREWDMVGEVVNRKGWSFVIKALKRCKESDVIVPGWDIGLRNGIIRDGMINILGLDEFTGLDVDYLTAFEELKGKDMEDLSESAKTQAFEMMQEQVKQGNTFFMDIERWKDNEFAFFVPDIIDARRREVERLGEKPHLYEVYSTYYGFRLLTHEEAFSRVGVSEDLGANIVEAFQDFGTMKELSGKQLKFSPLSFRKCTPHLRAVLWNMLRLKRGGFRYKNIALEKLSKLADSRALDMIYRFIDRFANAGVQYTDPTMYEQCFRSLGKIGHPSSGKRIEQHIEMNFRKPGYLREALSGIRGIVSPELDEWAERRYHGRQKGSLIFAVRLLGNTRLRKYLPFYAEARTFGDLSEHKKLREAIELAESNVHPPYDEFLQTM
jgi:hypothetical protein